jgi:hypothetical protein
VIKLSLLQKGQNDGINNIAEMNPDFHFALAMDVFVCTAGVGNFLRTRVCTSPLLQKGQNDGINNIASVFYGIQCSLNNFELGAIIMTNH